MEVPKGDALIQCDKIYSSCSNGAAARKEFDMTIIVKATAVALVLASATLASGCVTRDNDRYGYSGHHRHGSDNAQVSLEFGNIDYGYNDGYWDNRHQWHQWSSDNDRDSYRNYRGSHYSDWKHDRDGNDGWRGN